MELKKIHGIVFKYLISLFVFDILILFIFNSTFDRVFAYIPYYRLSVILFTFIFFTPIFLVKSQKFKLRKVKNEDYVVIMWCLFTFIEFMHGVVVGNPKLYLIADFIYIIFGGYIYIMLSNLISNNKDTEFSLVNFAKWLILIFILFYFINKSFSENYYFILLSLGYIFLIKKKYWLSAFVLIPFLIQIKDSNRALLICFVTVVIFYFIYKIGLYLKKQDRIFIFTFLFFFLVFFSQELLSILFEIVPKGSGLHFRIKQVLDIFNNGIDFNNPQHISIAQRIVEAKVVVSLWLNNIVSFLFGCGLGGVIDGKLFIDPSVTKTALMGSKSIHNIHLLPFALIHKYGLLGLIIFFMLVIDLLNSFRNILKKNQNIIFIFWNLVFILIFVYSLPAASFLWASPLFWISLSMKRKVIYKKPV